MSLSEDWREANETYLSTALAWLRLRLEQLALQQPAPTAVTLPSESSLAPTVDPPLAAPDQRRWRLWRAAVSSSPVVVEPVKSASVELPAGSLVDMSETRAKLEAEAKADMEQAERSEPPPALIQLGNLLGLSEFERRILLLCCAMELDTRIPALCARAQDDPARPYPTFALALALFEAPDWAALSPERPLRAWRLVEIHQPGAQTLTTSALRADERIVNAVKGLNYLDDRLTPFLTPIEPELISNSAPLPPSQQAVVHAITQHFKNPTHGTQVVQLLGTDVPSKLIIAQQAADAFHRKLYRLSVESLPAFGADLETLARLWLRESLLLPVAIYLDAQALSGGTDSKGPGLNRFLAASGGLLFLGVREVWEHIDRTDLILEVGKPTAGEQKAAWAAALGERAGDNPDRLSGQFSLDFISIRQIAQGALNESAPAEAALLQEAAIGDAETETREAATALAARLWAACRDLTRPRMDSLAQRIETKATLDDLVLPPEQKDLLGQIANQVGQRSRVYQDWGFALRSDRGLGISALFAGESGTGKTMAAEALANYLGLNLYRIDLSGVVSKYIGETEENLRKLFDAAEDGGALLFFDEADALFGKRSEVKDSHDRYANIEINYLLQRMEAYRGLAILATNMKSALDTAFIRRLRFIVNFPFPGVEERRRIWEQAFPDSAPIRSLDYDRLARLMLTGGNIANVAMNAAFLAASAGTQISMPLILAAARTECLKLERPINEADFRWSDPAEAAA